MAITIIGAGAIGGVIAGYLAKSGENITLVDVNEAHIQRINKHGLRVEALTEDFTTQINAVTMEEFMEMDLYLDIVFLAVKAQHTETAILQIKNKLNNESMVVSLQNGLCEQVIANLIGVDRTIGSFVNIFSDYIGPGHIKYGGAGSLYIGELDGSFTNRLEVIHRKLLNWGDAKKTSNIQGYLWGKMSYASVLIATALTDERIVDVLKPVENREVLIELASEALVVAHQEGVEPEEFDDWVPSLIYPKEQRNWTKINSQFDKHINRLLTYKKVKTGFWRDLKIHKRKTEVPYYLEPVIELAKKHNIATPLTCSLLGMIKEIENEDRLMTVDNLEILKTI
ncbi:ketopantoate reductase family protein [Virgibacillus halodenitrificans]|uniref:ketopantoate reductase family protein n=1 Tax=Virgibacillus halodenitrificans TaxID=1482 RepID=UPI0007619AF4